MSNSSIQGQLLEVTVVGCSKLKNTEWISKQDPYVCLEYGSSKFRTNTCTDGGINPTFQEKFVFTLVEGIREINVEVWNSNTLSQHNFIGSGKIQLQKVISQGFDDCGWPLQTKSGRHSGELRVILYFGNANKQASGFPFASPPYAVPQYPTAPLAPAVPYPFPTPAPTYPPPQPYPYPPSYCTYPPPPSYPPQPYPPPPSYPPQPYPPPPSYPPYNPAGVYPGYYNPPPY